MSSVIDIGSARGQNDRDERALIGALRSERAMLEDLLVALRRQRSAVAADDLEVVESSVQDVHRILMTLTEALTRRRALLAILTGSDQTKLHEVKVSRMDGAHRELSEVTDDLISAARVVALELGTTRTMLRGAITGSETDVGAPCSPPAEAAVYGREATVVVRAAY